MEAKLKEYRARRRRQEFVEQASEKLENSKRHFVGLFKKMIKINVDDSEVNDAPIFEEVEAKDLNLKETRLDTDYDEDNRHKNKCNEKHKLIEIDSETNEDEVVDEKPPETWQHFIIKWTFYTMIWVTLYIYFLSLQYGAVFFAVSLLIGIYLNTSTRPRKKGEASAYSVFNENCESIDGTVTAEKLQKEMFFGSFRLF